MAKILEIIMVGVISGIVAYTTSQLGIAGTVIGAVVGSMLYQVMSHFFKEPLEDKDLLEDKEGLKPSLKAKNVESSIFYVFPLIIILAIEVIYLMASFYHRSDLLFQSLESATSGNLFRTIGVGLLIMGVYPLLEPERIPPIYGVIIMAVGLVKLLAGFADFKSSSIVAFYAPVFQQFSEVISIVLIAALLYVIVSIIQDSVNIKGKTDRSKTTKGKLELNGKNKE